MRTITTDTIIQNIKEMCIEANYSLTSDVKDKLYQAAEEENWRPEKKKAGKNPYPFL